MATEAATDTRPTRALPTNRLSTQKQFDTLRAFGAASEPDRKTVTNVDVSKIVGVHAATVGLNTGFFTDIGLLEKTNEGLRPAVEVVEFTRAYEWSPQSAAKRLAPKIRTSWFAECLLPKLRFNAMSVEKAVSELAMSVKAGPKYKTQVETLLEYLEAAGIVAVNDNQVRLLNGGSAENGGTPSEVVAEGTPDKPSPAPSVQSFVSLPNAAAGVVQFNVSVKVDMTEFSGWSPDRIAAFFSGMAQVLAAKSDMEETKVTSM